MEQLPKTKMSASPVPTIKLLVERLELDRIRSGNFDNGPIFRNTSGRHLSMKQPDQSRDTATGGFADKVS
jgi:hypothetical protein